MRRLLTLLLLSLSALAPSAAAAAPGPVAIFYYPWYDDIPRSTGYPHWAQGARRPPLDIASGWYPARGAYSSADRATVAAQMREIAAAGVSEVVSSWWGWGSLEDARLPAIAAEARPRGLDVSVQIEPYPGRTAASVTADIGHLRELGVTRFYVYGPEQIPDADWAALNDGLTGVVVLAQTALAGRALAGRFDGLYTYDVLLHDGGDFPRICAQARAVKLLCAPSVGPGYDSQRATGDPRTRPRRDGRTYDEMWRGAIRARPDAITITSYNEWHEGTQIEPARAAVAPDGFRYATYAGAWGATGRRAQTAYLERTAAWARAYRSGGPPPRR